MRLLTSTLLLALFVWTLSLRSIAQDTPLHYPMGGESVTQMMKTDNGSILLGTNNGIALYDGREIRKLEIDDCQRPYNFTNDIARLHDGRILVAMRNGLYIADLTKESCQQVADGITEAASIITDCEGRIWIACRQGLARLSDDLRHVEQTVKVDPSNVTSPDNRIVCAAADKRGLMWMTNGRGSLYSFDPARGETKRAAEADSLLTSPIVCMATAGKWLYIGTLNSGLVRVDTSRMDAENIGGLPASIKQLKNINGIIYICTDGGGAFRLTDTGLSQRATTENAVYACMVDTATDTEWFGYYQNGFSCSLPDTSIFTTYSYSSFDSKGMYVRSFCKHGREIVVGTRQGLLFISETQDIVRHFSPETLGCAIITDIKYFGGLYVFTSYEQGVFCLNPKTLETAPLAVPRQYSESSCNSLIVSADSSRLYVGSSRGLVVMDRQLKVVASYDDRHSDMLGNYIYDMMLDKDGKLWISTTKGMCIFNTRTEKFQDNGFPNGFWHSVPNLTFFASHDGDILAASELTLYFSRSDLSSFKELNMMQRLGLGQVDFISAVDSSYMVGTDQGLFVFDRSLSRFRQFCMADGLPSARFSRFDSFKDEEGRIWMATSRGLVQVSQSDILLKDPCRKAKVVVSSYTLGDRERSTRRAQICTATDNCAASEYAIDVPWHFTSALLSLMPSQLDNDDSDAHRCYEWQMDGEETHIAYESSPVVIKSLSLGDHTLLIRQAGYPSTATTALVRVRPSVWCYVELLILSLLIALVIMALRLQRRRRLYAELLRQKHKMELELASASAISRHKQREEEQRELANQRKLREKEEQVRQRSVCYKQIHEKVECYMKELQPYLDVNLRLADIAEHTGTNVTTLSQMFNDYLHSSYFDYINRYRIEHFKRIASDPANAQMTLIALSEMSGFKRSSFFNVFKKMEGCTPNEWMKSRERSNTDATLFD